MATAEGLDELLSLVGTGRWNYLFFSCAGLLVSLQAVYLVGSDFLNPDPQFKCNILEDNNTRPVNGSQCFVQEEILGDSNAVVPCKSWIYDTSVFHSTISMEWDLVCTRAWISPLFQTIYTAGNFIGALLGGLIADKYGRRMAVRVGSFVSTAAAVLMVFMPWISGVLLCRFMIGAAYSIMLFPSFILCMEVCEPKLRLTVGVLLGLPYALMTVFLAGMAYLIRGWRLIQIVGILPAVFLLPLTMFIDESPRWLVVMGRLEKAVKVFERAIKLNRTNLPHDLDLNSLICNIHKKLTNDTTSKTSIMDDSVAGTTQVTSTCESCGFSPSRDKEGSCVCQSSGALGLEDGVGPWWAGPLALFKTPVMRKMMVVLLCVRVLVAMLYLGLPLNASSFSSPFLYMAMMGLVEVPAYSVSILITRRLGRKQVVAPCLIASGLMLFIYLTVREAGIQIEWLHMMLVLISYLLACTAYQVNFLYAPELLPTTLRPWGIAACVLCAYLGYSITPFITDNKLSSASWLPSAVFGSCGVIAGLLIFLLPETSGRDLPETVRDLRHRLDRERSVRSCVTEDVADAQGILRRRRGIPEYGSTTSHQ